MGKRLAINLMLLRSRPQFLLYNTRGKPSGKVGDYLPSGLGYVNNRGYINIREMLIFTL